MESIGGRNDGLIVKTLARFNEDNNKLEAEYAKQIESIQKKHDGNYANFTEKFEADYKKFQETYAAAFDTATATNNTKINEFNQLFVEEHKKFAEEHERLVSDFTELLNNSQIENDRMLNTLKDEQNQQLLKSSLEMVQFEMNIIQAQSRAPETANYTRMAGATGETIGVTSGRFDAKQ